MPTPIAEAIQKIGARELAGGGMVQGERPPFVAKPTQGAKPAAVGRARASGSNVGSSGDLTESTTVARTYWPTQTIMSSDGIFTIEIDPIKTVTMIDGRKINFAEPDDV